MSRMIIAACIAVVLCIFCVAGCPKESEPPAPAPEQTKTAAEYKAEAEKEIKEENASAELEKLQQSIDQEAAQEQQ